MWKYYTRTEQIRSHNSIRPEKKDGTTVTFTTEALVLNFSPTQHVFCLYKSLSLWFTATINCDNLNWLTTIIYQKSTNSLQTWIHCVCHVSKRCGVYHVIHQTSPCLHFTRNWNFCHDWSTYLKPLPRYIGHT